MLTIKKEVVPLWITNVGDRSLAINDLGIRINPGQSINLFDFKHFRHTEAQVRQSIKSGSIYEKRQFIKVRKIEPNTDHFRPILDTKQSRKWGPRLKPNDVSQEVDYLGQVSEEDHRFAAEFVEQMFELDPPKK